MIHGDSHIQYLVGQLWGRWRRERTFLPPDDARVLQKEPQSLDIVLEKTDDLKLEVIVIGLNFKHKTSHTDQAILCAFASHFVMKICHDLVGV